jgi:hypothetical protein
MMMHGKALMGGTGEEPKLIYYRLGNNSTYNSPFTKKRSILGKRTMEKMEKSVRPGIIVLLVILLVSPVAAWHADVTLSGPTGDQCSTCDFYIYTINAYSAIWDEHILRVNDTLPAGLDYVAGSSTTEPGVSVDPKWDTSTRTLTWDFYDVPKHTYRNITFKVTPTDLTSVKNTAETRVMPTAFWEDYEWGLVVSNTVTTTFSDTICPIPSRPIPSPEFPTLAIPATFIMGILGAVLFIKRAQGD